VAIGRIASRFHTALSAATTQALTAAASRYDCETVVLAGGVFQNRRLLERVVREAREAGLRVLLPERLPLGDGAISFGQAVVAARQIEGAAGS
jgi:hydrogenase maturation protein HypF